VPADRKLYTRRPNATALARFLTVVSKLIGEAPTAWKDGILSAEANNVDAICFDNVAQPRMSPIETLRHAAGVGFEVKESGLAVAGARAYTWNLPHPHWEGVDQVAVLFAGDRVYVAPYWSWPTEPCALYALAPETGRIIWSARVWNADGFEMNAGGAGFGNVELRVSGNLLTVFGVGNDAAYIEQFDARDGSNRCRFCTRYFDLPS
jgi:hypothetical protein